MSQKPSDNKEVHVEVDAHSVRRRWLMWGVIATWWLAVIMALVIAISARPGTLPRHYLWFPCIFLAIGIGLKISWSPVRALLKSFWLLEPFRRARQALVQVFIAGTFGVFSDVVLLLLAIPAWVFRKFFPEEMRKQWHDDWHNKK